MPTVLRQDGFEFVIYYNDHEPMHTHVFKGDGELKINLDPVEMTHNWGMKKNEARKAKSIGEKNQTYLMERWREING